MVSPISVKVGENADIECCTKCQCLVTCWPWRKKHKKGDISPISERTLDEIQKTVETYEKRRNSISNDPTLK